MSSPQHGLGHDGPGITQQTVIDHPGYSSKDNNHAFIPFCLTELRSYEKFYKEITFDFEKAGLQVIKIRRLQNVMKWKAYKSTRDIIYEQRSKLDPKYSLNERYLYHGTSAKLQDLCEVGLDDKLAGNGCFGKGIYFSDNPKKCTKYANRRDGDEEIILCVRVILGHSKVYADGKQDRSLLREPEKTSPFIGWRFYDSAQGCPRNLKEFVVYRAHHAMIEYVITYSQMSLKKRILAYLHEEKNLYSSKPTVVPEPSFLQDDSLVSKTKVSNLLQVFQPGVAPARDILAPLISSPSARQEDNSSDDSSNSGDDDDTNYQGQGGHDDTSSDEENGGQQATRRDNDTNSSESDTDSNYKSADRKSSGSETYGNFKSSELILAQKKQQFSDLTGEYSEIIVETFLLASKNDITKAVDMYKDKSNSDIKRAQRLINPTEDEELLDEAIGGSSEPQFIQGQTLPNYNSPEWKSMTGDDKEIACDEQGSKGDGFVHFETEETACRSIEKINGMLLSGKKVDVGNFIPRKERIMMLGDKHSKFNNVYIKNLPDEFDDDKLRDMFESFGKIISAKIMVDNNKKSRGFGFVSFEDPEDAEKAVTSMNGIDNNGKLVASLNGLENTGKVLYCGRAQKKAERQAEIKESFEKIKKERFNRYQGVNLYVKNLDHVVDDERLRKEFSQFGTITSAKVMGDGSRSKGFGFVCFSSPEEATKAVFEMNGRIIEAKPLYVALAERKEDRRAHLASQRMASMRQNVPFNTFNPSMAPASCYVPTVHPAQRGFFTSTNISSIRPGQSSWAPGVRATQAAAGFPAMSNQMRPRAPSAQVRPSAVNSRAITGQSVGAGAARGVPVNALRPQGMSEARPAGYPSGPR